MPIRVEDIFFIGIMLFYREKTIPLLRAPQTRTLLIVLILYLITSLVSFFLSVFDGYSPVQQDFNSLFNLIRILIIFCSGVVLGKHLKLTTKNLLIILSLGAFFSAAISLVQYYNLLGLGKTFYIAYGDKKFISDGVGRAIGSLGNPNYASFFQLIGFIVLLILEWPKSTVFKLVRLIFLGLLFLSVFVTFSRTGLITILLVLVTYFYLKGKLKLVFFCILTLFIIAINMSSLFSETRYSSIINKRGSVDMTLNGRVNLIWQEKIVSFLENPIWGEGTREGAKSKTLFSVVTFDNGFLYLLVANGIVGTIIYISFFFFQLKFFDRLKKTKLHELYLFIILFNLSTLIYFVTTDMPKAVIFMTYFYFMIGLLTTYSQSHLKKMQLK